MSTADRNYRETLEAAAQGYLQRHQAQHLDGQDLFNLGVVYLMTSLGADKAMAEIAVALAYGELHCGYDRRYLDVSASNGHTAIIADPDSGLSYAVPVALICQVLLDAPQRKHLLAAT